jgi:hypothetical protein
MPSPFPGMDPYIESSGRWGDFHGSLLGAIRADLNARLPDGYAASIELYVWTGEEDEGERPRLGEPDVFVHEDDEAGGRDRETAAIAAPATTVLPRLTRRKRKYIQVMDVGAKKVVTVVEVLSPSSKKAGTDRAVYLEKRNEYLANKLSFVEIDLLRAGKRPPLGKGHPEVTDYYAMVCRSWEFPRAGVWTFGIRDPLPDLPVPVTLREGDTPLRLRWCVDRAYDEGRYSTGLPYDEPLKPRPRDQDRDWVAQILTKRRR